MKVVFSPAQLTHRPTQFMRAGVLAAPVETPERLAGLADALAAMGLERVTPEGPLTDDERAAVAAVHAPDYLAFLDEAHALWRALPGAGPEVLPNAHPLRGADEAMRRRAPPMTGIVARANWFMGDLACGIGPATRDAAHASARAATVAADAVLAGEGAALALCRPPGHHAGPDRAAGFCYLNNAAIAAERLRRRFARVAVLDFDAHHGDGTQAAFYARADVLTASLHADPAAYYPYFTGYADERGHGAGEGANLNLPLAHGGGDAAFLAGVGVLTDAARAHGAEALVVAAGWDAHRDDPLGVLRVTAEGFSRAGAALGGLRLPTVIVQEGGYAPAAVADCAPRFVAAFLDARG